MRAGAIVLVVGPSGAGKDSLLCMARDSLAADGNFEFPQRTITRAPDETESHQEVSALDFERAASTGAFALSWEAHGHRYGIPRSVDDSVAQGKTVVVNVSRGVVESAARRYRQVVVVLVTASQQNLTERLTRRGRESRDAVRSRINRAPPPLPDGLPVITIENNGTLAEAAVRFIQALRTIHTNNSP